MPLLQSNFGLIQVINPSRIETVSSINGASTIVFSPQSDVNYYIDGDSSNTATLFAGSVRGIDKGQVFTFNSPVICELVDR